MIKIRSKNNLYPHSHFIEHLVGAFEKTTTGEQLKLENLDLFDPVAQDKTDFLPATIHNQREQKLPPKYLQTNFRSAVSS
jgi:hypothetical protein